MGNAASVIPDDNEANQRAVSATAQTAADHNVVVTNHQNLQSATTTAPQFSDLVGANRHNGSTKQSASVNGDINTLGTFSPSRSSSYAKAAREAFHDRTEAEKRQPIERQPVAPEEHEKGSTARKDHASIVENAGEEHHSATVAPRVGVSIGSLEKARHGSAENRPGDRTVAASDDQGGGAAQSRTSITSTDRRESGSQERSLPAAEASHEKEAPRMNADPAQGPGDIDSDCQDGGTVHSRREIGEQGNSGSEKRSLLSGIASDDAHDQHPHSSDINMTSAGDAVATGKHRHRRRRHHHRRRRKYSNSTVDVRGGDEDHADAASEHLGQRDKLKLLLEFIPYFGTGNPSRDNMVRSILSAADPQELAGDRDEYENTLLILACQYRCMGLVPIILARGDGVINVNAVNSAGACALHFACYKDSICVETAELLLERGAQPEVVENTYGCTPLHYAAGAGDLGLCRRLVQHGAKANTWDFHHYTAADYAKQSGAADCVAYLEEVSASSSTNAGQTVVKASAGTGPRGGIVTGNGDNVSMLFREESFGNIGGDDPAKVTAEPPALLRQLSAESDCFSVGGEGDGYWGRQHDPTSSMTYYLNEKTGESVWEKDLLAQAKALRDDEKGRERASPQLEQWLKQQAHRVRLVAFLGRHDPVRLVQVDDMLKKRLGNEDVLFSELAKKYGAEEDPFMADLSKDAANGYRGRNTLSAATGCAVPRRSVNASMMVVGWAVRDGRVGGGGGRPPTAPSHGPGRRTGGRPATAVGSPGTSGSPGSVESSVSTANMQKVVPIPPALSAEDIKKLQEETQKHLDDSKAAHEETLEAERRAHRDRAAQREGTMARLEHDLKEASIEEERLRAKTEENRHAVDVLVKEVEAKLASQSGVAKALSEEAEVLRLELKNAVEATQALANQVDRDQSGAAAAAESYRRGAEAKAKEESDLVHASQASVVHAKFEADRARKDFDNLKRLQQQEIEGRLGMELLTLQREVASAKATAASDASRAQSDALAAKAKAEATAALWADVGAQRERMCVELERAKLTAERNTVLQGLIASESERRKMLHNKIEDLKGKIRVYVRVRPFSQKERDRGCTEAVEAQGKQSIAVKDPRVKEDKNFEFDQVWAGTQENGNNQVNIFKDTGYLVTSAVDGYNVCIFAYGQTGSGKTYTMFGAGGIGGGVDAATGQCDGTVGVTPRAVLELFRVLKEREAQHEYNVKVSMFELYRDGLRDLLAKKGSNAKLVIKLAEHSGTGLVVVEGGTERDANDIQSMINTIQLGAEGRTVSSTQMNSDSSRSHLLCSIVVSSTNRRTGSCIRGKLTLVDLAGSERVGKSGAAGDQLKEAQSINKSLSALGDVIGALTTGVQHIPYRNHALTMMMSDSLGGNSKTLMFVCASPADYNASETINALQFAARCKTVTNSVGAGGGAAAAAQVQALRRELQKLKEEGGDKGPVNTPIKLARPL